jgi:hypothetical protein
VNKCLEIACTQYVDGQHGVVGVGAIVVFVEDTLDAVDEAFETHMKPVRAASPGSARDSNEQAAATNQKNPGTDFRWVPS